MKRTIRTSFAGRAAILAVVCSMTAAPVTALAAKNQPDDQTPQPVEAPAPDYKKDMSPDFAYSTDKWAALRDNVMEYGELADLIHEYNPTVRSNRSNYSDQKNQDLTDISDEMMSDAYDLWDDADASDTDSYAGRMAQSQLNMAGNSLAKQADQLYMDADMYKIQYDQTEANLVFQAQQLMMTYEQSAYTLSNLKSGRDLAEASYEAVQAQQSVGMATQNDVLTARKSVQDTDASILSAQKSADNVHRNLCLMLGWSADSQPEIKPIPQPDLARIDAMNPQADLAQALANNYDIKYNEHKLENVRSSDLKESTRTTIESAKNTVENNLKTQYNAVLDSRDALDTANAKLQLETANLATMEAKAAAGSVSSLQLKQQQSAYTQAENNVETAKLTLTLAMEKYDWIKKGLTFQS